MTMMHLKIMLGLACDMRSLVQARDSVGEGGGDMNDAESSGVNGDPHCGVLSFAVSCGLLRF